jgi:hypothetical protein
MSDSELAAPTGYTLARRMPIDWLAIAEESGCTKGTLCKHSIFGWGIKNGNGDADFCCVTAPEIELGQLLRVEGNEWLMYNKGISEH